MKSTCWKINQKVEDTSGKSSNNSHAFGGDVLQDLMVMDD